MGARALVRIAIGWCGIIARRHSYVRSMRASVVAAIVAPV